MDLSVRRRDICLPALAASLSTNVAQQAQEVIATTDPEWLHGATADLAGLEDRESAYAETRAALREYGGGGDRLRGRRPASGARRGVHRDAAVKGGELTSPAVQLGNRHTYAWR